MAQTIQLRRGTAAQWTSNNPTLAQGEIGVETDTYLYKLGNGTDAWNDLGYPTLSPATEIETYAAQTSEPATPSADTLKIYARDMGGRIMPSFKGPSGIASQFQPAIFGNGMYIVSPGTTTAMNVLGGPAVTNVGTPSHPALTSASLRTQMSRAQVVSAATSNSAAETRAAFARVWRGDAAGMGGFFARFKFSIVSTTASQRTIVGLTSSTAAIAVTQEPSAMLNWIGVGNDAADTNLQMMTNNGVSTATKVDLGAQFPAQGIDDIYELTMFAAPNDTNVEYRMERQITGDVATGTFDNTKLPSSSTFLAPHVYMNNGGTAAAVQYDLARIYLETDY